MLSLTKKKCSVKGCDRVYSCKKYCNTHYERVRINGYLGSDRPVWVKHGLKNHFMYRSWVGMRSRCNNPKDKDYKNYGGRGIKVCETWSSFENFINDVGERPNGMSLDRIDNDGDYKPSNCKWSTPREQQLNRRTRASGAKS